MTNTLEISARINNDSSASNETYSGLIIWSISTTTSVVNMTSEPTSVTSASMANDMYLRTTEKHLSTSFYQLKLKIIVMYRNSP